MFDGVMMIIQDGLLISFQNFSGSLRFVVIVQQSSHALFFLAVTQASFVFEFSLVLCQSDELSGISLQWTVSTCV